MKFTLFISAAATLALTATMPAFAGDNGSMYGQTTPATTADRTVLITPNTRFVNVTHGEVVNFVVGNKHFTWDFNGPSTLCAIDLQQIAPGAFDHTVTAYVARDPLLDGA